MGAVVSREAVVTGALALKTPALTGALVRTGHERTVLAAPARLTEAEAIPALTLIVAVVGTVFVLAGDAVVVLATPTLHSVDTLSPSVAVVGTEPLGTVVPGRGWVAETFALHALALVGTLVGTGGHGTLRPDEAVVAVTDSLDTLSIVVTVGFALLVGTVDAPVVLVAVALVVLAFAVATAPVHAELLGTVFSPETHFAYTLPRVTLSLVATRVGTRRQLA